MVIKLTIIVITELVKSKGKPYSVMLSCEPMMIWLPQPIKAPPIKQLKIDFDFNQTILKERK